MRSTRFVPVALLLASLNLSTQTTIPRKFHSKVASVIESDEYEICTTPECVVAAASIIEALDESIDPCEDFYQFSCGGWEAANQIPATSGRYSAADVISDQLDVALNLILEEPQSESDPLPLNQVKNFYTACMDEVTLETIGLTALQTFLDQFGGWPIASSSWDESLFNWQMTVSETRRQIYASYLIGLGVYPDEKDVFTTIMYVDQTSLGISRTLLTNPTEYEELITAYKKYIADSAALLADSAVDQASIGIDVDDIFDFEAALAAITSPSEDRRDAERLYNKMTVEELQTLTGPSISWLSLLNTALASAGVALKSTDNVIVREVDYLKNLTNLVDSTDDRTIANYLMWRQVLDLGSDTNQAMRDVIFEYDSVANGVTSPDEREDVCVGKSNLYMGYAIGTRYVQEYFSQEAKNGINEMVEDLREAFKDLLSINEWMDDETIPLAEEKADYVTKYIGYPDFYDEEGGLEEYYAGLDGIDTTTHFNNVLTLASYLSNGELNDLGLPAVRDRFLTTPTIVNAFYAQVYNSITFPAGILQAPFYYQNNLEVLNYGGIGSIIGHEITHGFDDQGRQYDKDGNAIPWWSNATIEAFSGKAQCIIDQYSNYVVTEIGENLNGVNTQGENIADNGGLREAYLAYQKYVARNGTEPRLPGLESYTAEQLFFISNANLYCTLSTDEYLQSQVVSDPHSPGRFRVIGPASNMIQFSEAFNCPAGSPMNPDNKCIVW